MTTITGTNGAWGSHGAAPPPGQDGADGGDASQGADGESLSVFVTEETIQDLLGNNLLQVTSGAGGQGGSGSAANPGTPSGGTGGDGAIGGRGGDLLIDVTGISFSSVMTLLAYGGAGGGGGSGGQGGNGLAGIGGAAGLSADGSDSGDVLIRISDSVFTADARLDLLAIFAAGYKMGGYGRTGSSGDTPGNGGDGGKGGTGGTANIEVDGIWLPFHTAGTSHRIEVTGALGGLGGDGGRGGAATQVGSYGAGGRGGDGGRGSDVGISFTNNHLTGTAADEQMELEFILSGGRGGIGGLGGQGGTDLAETAAAGANGASGSANLTFAGNHIDGGAGTDSLTLTLWRSTFVDTDLGEVWDANGIGVIDVNLTTGIMTVGGQINTITGVENIYFRLEDSSYAPGGPLVDMPSTVYATGNSSANLLVASTWAAAAFSGEGGNDSLWGRDYNDYFQGGAGTDDLAGYGGDDTLLAGSGVDFLEGGDGQDYLDGGTGSDTMVGGGGDDTYVVDANGDIVNDLNGGGTDTVMTGLTWTLGTYIENLTLTGSANSRGTGNDLGNILTGNDGNNTLTGGLGDDSYFIQNTGDNVVEANGGGTDVIYSQVSYNLTGRFVETLVLTESATDAIGNSYANALFGNTVGNLLDGGGGADTLGGAAGDDTYMVNVASDVVIESADEGTDIVYASVSYVLSADIERLILTGTAANGTGNASNNAITGNDGNNVLDGDSGVDTLVGGLGNDTYHVDDSLDIVTEASGAGTDTVISSASYNLTGRVVENLTLTGVDDLTAIGNGVGNKLTGNTGNNLLDGGSGADTLTGGLGDDTYYVQATGDKVVEAGGQGADIIYASVSYTLTGRFVETLALTGSANINATGNSLANTLIGNAGANTLNGLGGNDILTGGLGADIFLFQLGSRTDTVTDFSADENDTINVNAYTGGVANDGLITQVGADTVINLGGGNVITVNNALQAEVLAHITW
ncbi:calcium-binding protein [Asticcacaulis sp. AC402]|uniref:calcium-binding protein n=1 Tax=Asticcacaulis sp. AC402 TaxID=1282361 RepID=UPI0003C409D4|nr:calcium-binding protein [Asticcacaulis sp. AC402]ESQ74097.1 hypothetical protein ABAC402_15710 [Asticcacaulis sp. AC402]